MRIFDVAKGIKVVADSAKTRNGFKHTATLILNGNEMDSVKINYLNRTWESFEYESVLNKLAEESTSLNTEGKKKLKAFIRKEGGHEAEEAKSMMRTTAMVAQMGEIFGQTKKEKNDWKTRMLKAGIKGIDIPEDWDTLSEEEKERRLNNVIKEMRG